jgi:UrcA family protein
MKTAIAIAALFVASISAPGAYAQDDAAPTASVSYADLDLSRESGRAALEHRIDLAVGKVCPGRPLPVEISKMNGYRTCRTQAWDGARQQLAKIYTGRLYADAQVQVVAGR